MRPDIFEDGSTCDGAACTFNDTCREGVCQGTSIDCGFLNEGAELVSAKSRSGPACKSTPSSGTACDDGDACTDRRVRAGACVGDTLDCSALDAPCFEGQCSPITGG